MRQHNLHGLVGNRLIPKSRPYRKLYRSHAWVRLGLLRYKPSHPSGTSASRPSSSPPSRSGRPSTQRCWSPTHSRERSPPPIPRRHACTPPSPYPERSTSRSSLPSPASSSAPSASVLDVVKNVRPSPASAQQDRCALDLKKQDRT
jgi:hypothetical protein